MRITTQLDVSRRKSWLKNKIKVNREGELMKRALVFPREAVIKIAATRVSR